MNYAMTFKSSFSLLCVSLVFLNACKEDAPEPGDQKINTIPEFFKPANPDIYGLTPPEFRVFGTSQDRLNKPQDLDFNPTRPDELWVVNKEIAQTGGGTVMFVNPGSSIQLADYRKDGNARHFMALPSALSFSNNGNWATSANILDANHNNGTFTGPTLWSGNLNIYAKPSGGNGSHLDMLHASPYCMGIENEKDNVFWVFDGYNGHPVRYDFVADHGPGNDDHSDGIVRRYAEISLKRDPDVPSHLVLDKEKKWLYIVDGGNQRVVRLDITSGNKLKNLALINEPLAEHSEFSGVSWEVVIPSSAGLKKPCGIEITSTRLFVSDYETGDIICFSLPDFKEIGRVYSGDPGIMGITLGPDGKLYYVNALTHEVGRLDPR